VECTSPDVRDTVEALFCDLAPAPASMPLHRLRIANVDHAGRLMLDLEGFGGFDPGPLPPDSMLDTLVSRISRLHLDVDSDRLHLHAAAVARSGHAAVISAARGTGKSTLATALVSRGLAYMSDECVALARGSRSITAFAKPISIKESGRRVFTPALRLEDRRVAFGPSEESWWNVPASRLGGTVVDEAEPSLIVILSRDPSRQGAAVPSCIPLHGAEAVVALVEQSMDAQRFGEATLQAIAGLAAQSRCVSVDVGTPATTAEMVDRLLAETLEDQQDVPLDRVDHGTVPEAFAELLTIDEAVISLRLGDRVVVQNTSTGRTAAFDPSGSTLWQALCGATVEPFPRPDAPGVDAFLAALSAEGFITPKFG
jgi:hypothetical protein